MKRIIKAWKIIVLDTLGVLLMLLAIATGWLPGPGGIPLFIIGLSLLAVHHDWAQRYIDLLKQYADRLGDLIFIKNPRVQLAYDIIAPIVILGGVLTLIKHTATWMIMPGVFLCFAGVTFLLGNRGRFDRLKKLFKH